MTPEDKLARLREWAEADDAERLAQFVREETDPLVLTAACATLARTRGADTVPLLRAWLSGGAALRSASVQALALLDDPAAAEALLEALRADDPVVALRAREALRRRGPVELADLLRSRLGADGLDLLEFLEVPATDLLLDFLESSEATEAARLQALAHLARRGEFDPPRTRRLRGIARQLKGSVQVSALQLLHRIEPSEEPASGAPAAPEAAEPLPSREAALRRLGEAVAARHSETPWPQPTLSVPQARVVAAREALAVAERRLAELEAQGVGGASLWDKVKGHAARLQEIAKAKLEVGRLRGDLARLHVTLGEAALAEARKGPLPGLEAALELERRAREAEDRQAREAEERAQRRKATVAGLVSRAGETLAAASKKAKDFLILKSMEVDLAGMRWEMEQRTMDLGRTALAVAAGAPEVEGVSLEALARVSEEVARLEASGATGRTLALKVKERDDEEAKVGRALFLRSAGEDLVHDALRRQVREMTLLKFRIAEKEVAIRRLGDDMARDDLALMLQRRRSLEEDVNRVEADILEQHGRFMTVIFTDMKDFTTKSAAMSMVDLMALLDEHDRLLEPQIRKYGGRVVKRIGDAVMASFENALDGVMAAVEIQLALRQRNRRVPPEQRFQVRIGINAGKVILKDDDLYGDTVNVASRVEGIAQPDQILLTQPVCDFLREARVKVKELGPRKLKGREAEVVVFEVEY